MHTKAKTIFNIHFETSGNLRNLLQIKVFVTQAQTSHFPDHFQRFQFKTNYKKETSIASFS